MFILWIGLVTTNAQVRTGVEINNLSDQQIQQIVTEMNARGLNMEQALQMAQLKGATPMQIDQIKQRIQKLLTSKLNPITGSASQKEQKINNPEELFSQKADFKTSEEVKRIFGFQLFNSENLTFEPSVNIPTPTNYVLGINDELLISVWGASQQSYQLQVGSNGAVTIPDIGPVYVSGMEFSKAKELIKKRLSAIYNGMNGESPNTFAEVSMSNLRSIRINVIGEVMVPGTYILPSTASAFNALFLSGGPNEKGSFRNIEVIRENKIIKTIDVYDYLVNANTQENIQLREQDILYIPTYRKRVDVTGEFKRNGIFELTEKDKLSDVIRFAGGFTDLAFKTQLSLTRITETQKKVIDVSESIYDSFVPNNGDSIVASKIIDRYENRVNIWGAVFHPGFYELTEGLTLSGLIKKAQGVREDYFSNRGQIIRLQNDLTTMVLPFNVDEILSGKNDIKLEREDQVVIQDIFSMRQNRKVQILGEVQHPGEFDFSENMTLKDLIFQAGGFKEAASESFIELARRRNYKEANELSDEIVKLFQFNIDRNLNVEDRSDTFHLEPFDYIYVRKAPSYHEQRTVYISGEVRYPGAYSISSKKERISDLIRRAGGLTPNAFPKGARIKRNNPMAKSNMAILRNNLNDSLLTKAEEQIANDQLELRLESILKNPGSDYDYFLKEGDIINVPEITLAIRIAGEVQNPIGMAYQDGKSLKYYIDRSGGFSDKARKRKTFVIYSDGTTKITHSFIKNIYPEIQPGCQIIVPQKPEKQRTDNTGKWLAIASTITTILVAITRF
jgi:protein involved in polysaccharide export with SLBB domain